MVAALFKEQLALPAFVVVTAKAMQHDRSARGCEAGMDLGQTIRESLSIGLFDLRPDNAEELDVLFRRPTAAENTLLMTSDARHVVVHGTEPIALGTQLVVHRPTMFEELSPHFDRIAPCGG